MVQARRPFCHLEQSRIVLANECAVAIADA
jgi:hypothetical protein